MRAIWKLRLLWVAGAASYIALLFRQTDPVNVALCVLPGVVLTVFAAVLSEES